MTPGKYINPDYKSRDGFHNIKIIEQGKQQVIRFYIRVEIKKCFQQYVICCMQIRIIYILFNSLPIDCCCTGLLKPSMNVHQFAATFIDLSCPDCGKVYKYKQSLALHRRVFCSKEPNMACPICPKKCYRKRDLQLHFRNVHSNVP